MSNLWDFSLTDIRKAQYERRLTKWGFKKNRKKREWLEIVEKVIERRNDGKDSEVIVDDQIIPAKKLRKEVRRYGHQLVESARMQFKDNRRCDSNGANSSSVDKPFNSSIAIVRSPKLQICAPRRQKFVQILPVPQLRIGLDISISPLMPEDSSFLRARPTDQIMDLAACMDQLVVPTSSLNKTLKAAMVPSEYSKLMSRVQAGHDSFTSSARFRKTRP